MSMLAAVSKDLKRSAGENGDRNKKGMLSGHPLFNYPTKAKVQSLIA